MVTITVTLSEDRMQKLMELAKLFRIAPEEHPSRPSVTLPKSDIQKQNCTSSV